LKSGNLILLEPSGPVKACNGIALPLALHRPANSQSNFDQGENLQYSTGKMNEKLVERKCGDGSEVTAPCLAFPAGSNICRAKKLRVETSMYQLGRVV
jgi:hypothetical protein